MKCDKILICMSSKLRYFDVSVKSFVDNVVKQLPNRPDFVGHFPMDDRTENNQESLAFLKKFVNIKKIRFERDPEPSSFNAHDFCENANQTSSNSNMIGNFYQWHNMKRCSELKKNLEKQNGIYDIVIWCRPDLFYFNQLENLETLEDRFWLIGHDNHLCGLNDRFCIGNSEQMHQRMQIGEYFKNEWYPRYSNDIKKLFVGKDGGSKGKAPQWNPEIVLKTYIREKLKYKTGKLKLCFGKMRSNRFATIPYWFSAHGSEYTGTDCEEDVYQSQLCNKIKPFVRSGNNFHGAGWGVVDVNKIQL